MRTARTLVFASVGLVIVALSSAASASPGYPADIKTDLSLSYDLGTTHCTICHSSNTGGIGTVVTPFGLAMKAAGLHLEDPAALETALMTLKAAATDSDCNGIPDIQQLIDGRDPNAPGEYINGVGGPELAADPGCAGQSIPPAFGCGAQLAPGAAPAEGAATLIGLGALVAAAAGSDARRRRRRRRASNPPR
jgi:hypothetical protein